ncbi:hypothetical protein [Halosolutus gelatinilyticus]|uniref:hypothetical protein n=1 Tax=Halosolutus gelatinilyticus TaxID=2931975 RepID=UPI001FF170EF|nr:hypothetical protein [Halosolutus gelatinilyticus]
MELSPEEYGVYWRGSIRIAAGALIVFLGYRFVVAALLSYGNVGAIAIGLFLLAALVLSGTFVATLGLVRVVRTAIDAEMRG